MDLYKQLHTAHAMGDIAYTLRSIIVKAIEEPVKFTSTNGLSILITIRLKFVLIEELHQRSLLHQNAIAT